MEAYSCVYMLCTKQKHRWSLEIHTNDDNNTFHFNNNLSKQRISEDSLLI